MSSFVADKPGKYAPDAGQPGSAAAIEDVEADVRRDLARSERHVRISSVVYPVALAAAVLLLWEGITRLFDVPRFLLPPPSIVLASLIDHAPLLLVS